jgi:hypothetical protein
VQAAQVFPDGKTFADAVPREAPQAIMAAYAREKPVATSRCAGLRIAAHREVATDKGGQRRLADRLFVLALLLQAQAMPPSPADIYGPLFSAVQAAQVFPDVSPRTEK